LVSCAAAARVVSGKFSHARVVLGCVSPMPHLSAAANDFLEGKPLDEPTVAEAAELILLGAKPLEFNGYKVPLARTLVRRALLSLNG
jgi:xanthine dehydrogenase YagS FAD-binding subunit